MELEGYKKMEIKELQKLQLEIMKEIHEKCVQHNIKYYIIAGSLLGAVRHGGFIPWDDDIDIAMMREDYDKFMSLFPQIMDTNQLFLQHYGSDVDFRPALMRVCIKGTYLDFSCEAHWRYCKNTYIDIFPLDNVPDTDEEQVSQEIELKRLDKIIRAKLYRMHEENSTLTKLVKKMRACLLAIYPLKKLQKDILSVMTKYNHSQTEKVCSMASHYSYKKQSMPRIIYGTPTLVKFEDTELYAPEKVTEYLVHLYGENFMQIPPEGKRDVPNDVYIKV